MDNRNVGNKGFPGKIKNGFCIRKYQQIEKFPEECGNCISAWANREMRRCRNTVFALRDNPKTVSGGKIRAAEYAGGRSEARHTGNAKTVFFGTAYCIVNFESVTSFALKHLNFLVKFGILTHNFKIDKALC
jgi:hypothetical protein